jgi:broad specificity phosphatase PhoE
LTTFYLVRHGTTDWVEKQLLHGITDIPLNEAGLKQAAKTAEAMKGIHAKYLFCSPLTRTIQTAELIGRAVGLTPQPRQGLIEINFGWKEGKKTRDETNGDCPIILEKLEHYWMCLIRQIAVSRSRVSK